MSPNFLFWDVASNIIKIIDLSISQYFDLLNYSYTLLFLLFEIRGS